MYKRTAILFILTSMFFCASAQKDFEYVDSSVLDPQIEKQQQTYNNEPFTETDDDITGDTAVHLRSITAPSDSMVAWKNKRSFAWAANLDSLLKAKQNEESKKSVAVPRRRTPSLDKIFKGSAVQVILWTLAAIFVIYIVYKLFLNGGLFKGSSKSKPAVKETATEDELYLQQNFDQLIQQAYKVGDYRVATRYLFLKTLQRLSDRSLIEFAIDKTNSKYLYEIPENRRNDFAGLILNYEYAWYGNLHIDKETYGSIENKFNDFLNRI